MPFKILYGQDGKPYVEAGTPAEALEFLKLASNGSGSHGAEQMSLPLDEPHAVALVFNEIAERPRKLLRVLLDFPEGTDVQKVAEAIKYETSAFGGLLGSVSKQARKVNLKSEDFFFSELKNSGTKRYRFIAPGKLLRMYSTLLRDDKELKKLVGG